MGIEVDDGRAQDWGIPLRVISPLAIRIDQITAPGEVPITPGDLPPLLNQLGGRVAMMVLDGGDEPDLSMPGRPGDQGPPGAQGPTGWPLLEVPEEPIEPAPYPGATGPVGASGAGSIVVRRNSGADVGTRPRLNFIEGSGMTITAADDAVDGEVDITLASTGGAAAAAAPAMPYLPDQYEEPEIPALVGRPLMNLHTWRRVYFNEVAGAAVTSWDITTGLLGEKDVMYLIYVYVVENATNNVIGLRFNNDTGNNYGRQAVTGSSTTAAAARETAQSRIAIGFLNAAGARLYATMDLFASKNFERLVQMKIQDQQASLGTTISLAGAAVGVWDNSADEINRITVFSSVASGIGIGSKIEIWAIGLE